MASSRALSEIPVSAAGVASSVSRKVLAVSRLAGLTRRGVGQNAGGKCKEGDGAARAVTLLRWGKFNVVGAMGILVQFAALFFLKGVLHLNYLAATALAVEIAVVHNFVWHERYTWADRTRSTRAWNRFAALRRERESLCRSFGTRSARAPLPGTYVPGYRIPPLRGSSALVSCGVFIQNFFSRNFVFVRALKRCASRNFGASCGRLLRFNLTAGAVSIFGNLGMMRCMVGFGHMNYLLANGIAIAVCSLVNFVVSDGWVFGE